MNSMFFYPTRMLTVNSASSRLPIRGCCKIVFALTIVRLNRSGSASLSVALVWECIQLTSY